MPSATLLVGLIAMTVGIASAMLLQFARNPPRYALSGAIAGLIGGLCAIVAALATSML
jgi:ammonia channel protein AmtB